MPYKSLKKRLTYARKWRELHPQYMTAYARWLSAHERHPNVPKPGPVPVKKIKGRVKISLAKPLTVTDPRAPNEKASRRNPKSRRAENVALHETDSRIAQDGNGHDPRDLQPTSGIEGQAPCVLPAGGA